MDANKGAPLVQFASRGIGTDLLTWTMNESVKKVFLWDYNVCLNNWSSEVKDIMTKIGLTRHFENKSPCNLADAKVSLQNLYAKDWPAKALSVAKLRTYVAYKISFCPEKYVMLIKL